MMNQTKVVRLFGVERTLYLRNCALCDEPTWFNESVFCCDDCTENYHAPNSVDHRRSTMRSDDGYHGYHADDV